MEAMRIKQRITREGIMIPFHTVQQFQGQRVEIIILPDTEGEPAPRRQADIFYTSPHGCIRTIWRCDSISPY